MLSILNQYGDIDAIYSHNDGMSLGSIDAMKESGINPGKDIVIVSIDAEQAAIDALRAGEMNCVIECNPKTGPVIMDLAKKLAAGETIPRVLYVDKEVFYETDDLSSLAPRGY
jgi:simple sugar transport system substrate-binding protein